MTGPLQKIGSAFFVLSSPSETPCRLFIGLSVSLVSCQQEERTNAANNHDMLHAVGAARCYGGRLGVRSDEVLRARHLGRPAQDCLLHAGVQPLHAEQGRVR